MPFRDRLETFKFHYDPDDPDFVITDTVIVYRQPSDGTLWIAPSGVRTDGQSVPSPLWPLFGYPLAGRSMRPAALHDYWYQRGLVPKKRVDQMFREALIEEHDPLATSKYYGVKFFGFWAWYCHRWRQRKKKTKQ
jgi:hypothetical protein